MVTPQPLCLCRFPGRSRRKVRRVFVIEDDEDSNDGVGKEGDCFRCVRARARARDVSQMRLSPY